jgi:hypothetical protein
MKWPPTPKLVKSPFSPSSPPGQMPSRFRDHVSSDLRARMRRATEIDLARARSWQTGREMMELRGRCCASQMPVMLAQLSIPVRSDE